MKRNPTNKENAEKHVPFRRETKSWIEISPNEYEQRKNSNANRLSLNANDLENQVVNAKQTPTPAKSCIRENSQFRSNVLNKQKNTEERSNSDVKTVVKKLIDSTKVYVHQSIKSDESDSSFDDEDQASSNDDEDIFGSSHVFVAAHCCHYVDSNEQLRKGKLYLTINELFFKCVRMPFVRFSVKFSNITDVTKVKHFNNKNLTVLLLQTNDKAYAFSKFKMPKTLIRNHIIHLIKESKANNDESLKNSVDTENESLKTTKTRLRRISKSLSSFANILKVSNLKIEDESSSKSNSSNEKETQREEANDLPANASPKLKKHGKSLRKIKRIKEDSVKSETLNSNEQTRKSNIYIKNNQIKQKSLKEKSQVVENELYHADRDTETEDIKPVGYRCRSESNLLAANTNDNSSKRKRIKSYFESIKKPEPKDDKMSNEHEDISELHDATTINADNNSSNLLVTDPITNKISSLSKEKNRESFSTRTNQNESNASFSNQTNVEPLRSEEINSINENQEAAMSSSTTKRNVKKIKKTKISSKIQFKEDDTESLSKPLLISSLMLVIAFLFLTISNFIKMDNLQRQINNLYE